jgi:S-adenosyl-L-methionine hydrolase (adenosine-forming)
VSSITLLTDFGTSDVYVGIMKGAIAKIAPNARIIDLTHDIPPQNLSCTRFSLMSAYPYFPAGTIHVVVVDPGVGSQRRAIAVELSDGIVVAPDNGVVGGVLSQPNQTVKQAVSLTNPDYWRVARPSSTFHGRDIFAPVAAYLANGVPLPALGEAIAPESLVQLPVPQWQRTGLQLVGSIQAIDHFGNAITTIPATAVNGRWQVQVGDRYLPGHQTYAEVRPGDAIGLIGSHGFVEVAVNRGNAQALLNLAEGDRVTVQPVE